MELCPYCESQTEPEQIVCHECGMILKDINIYYKFINTYPFCCLGIFLIYLIVNTIIGILLLNFYY